MLNVHYPISPKNILLEASTVCQLRCVSCPTAQGNIKKDIGSGFLKFNDFKRLVNANPWIQKIELSNFGEIFLNPDICKIIAYAYEKKIALHADNGANLNNMTNETIESLVKYHFNSITCSIDGVDNESYQKYRVRGNFDTVISNIKKINDYKEKYGLQYPQLLWQYIAFGHNEHLIDAARKIAKELNMNFYVKISYEDMYDGKVFSPIKNRELIKKETGLDVGDRQEYYNKYGISYIRATVCNYGTNLKSIMMADYLAVASIFKAILETFSKMDCYIV